MNDVRNQEQRSQSGAIAVMLALMLPVLLGLLGLVLDGGFLFDVKNKMQSAADTAALGAAVEARRGGSLDKVIAAARDAAAENAFPDGKDGTTVQVSVPPKTGPYAGKTGYAEVSISQPRAPFLPIFGNTATTVRARAVAGLAESDICLLALEQLNPKKKKRSELAADSAKNTLVVDKGASLDLGTCSVIVDSSSSEALRLDGSISAGRIALAGSAWARGGSLSPSPELKVPPTSDPFASLATPSTSGTPRKYEKAKGAAVTIYPGVYSDDVKVEKDTEVTMSPGVYVFLKKFEVEKASLIGDGVTIYIGPSGEFKSKDAEMDLKAPTSGTYEAILFFQDRDNGKSVTFDGDGELSLEGVIYAEEALVKFGKKSTGRSAYTVIVAAAVKFSKKVSIQADFSGLSSGSPIKQIALAE